MHILAHFGGSDDGVLSHGDRLRLVRINPAQDETMISVIEIRPGRWAYQIDGKFDARQYDSTWGLTTYPTAEEAEQAAKQAQLN